MVILLLIKEYIIIKYELFTPTIVLTCSYYGEKDKRPKNIIMQRIEQNILKVIQLYPESDRTNDDIMQFILLYPK